MKKKLLTAVASLLLATSLIGCSNNQTSSDTESDTSTSVAPLDTEWPGTFQVSVSQYMDSLGVSDVLPGIKDGIEYKLQDNIIIVTFESVSKASEALESYISKVKEYSFIAGKTDEQGRAHFASPNLQYEIILSDGSKSEPQHPEVYVAISTNLDVISEVQLVENGFSYEQGFPTDTLAWTLNGNTSSFSPIRKDDKWFIKSNEGAGPNYGYIRMTLFVTLSICEDEIVKSLTDANYELIEGLYVSEDKQVRVQVKHGYNYSYLIVMGPEVVETTWPTSRVEALLKRLAPSTTKTLPELTSGNAYLVITNENGGQIRIKGDFTDISYEKAMYKVALVTEADWDNTASDYFDEANGDLRVYLTYTDDEIIIEVNRITKWIEFANEANELLQIRVPGSTTILPSLEGATNLEINENVEGEFDAYGYGSESANMLIPKFAKAFIDANWFNVGDNRFVSPNIDVIVSLKANANYAEVHIDPFVAPLFPQEEVNAFMNEYLMGFTIKDEDIADVEQKGYFVSTDDVNKVMIISVFGNHVNEVSNSLKALLDENGFHETEEGSHIYNGEFGAIISIYSEGGLTKVKVDAGAIN